MLKVVNAECNSYYMQLYRLHKTLKGNEQVEKRVASVNSLTWLPAEVEAPRHFNTGFTSALPGSILR